jgi:hypothetical protein
MTEIFLWAIFAFPNPATDKDGFRQIRQFPTMQECRLVESDWTAKADGRGLRDRVLFVCVDDSKQIEEMRQVMREAG